MLGCVFFFFHNFLTGTVSPPFSDLCAPEAAPLTNISWLLTEGLSDPEDSYLCRSPTFKGYEDPVISPTASSFDKFRNAFPGDPLAKQGVRIIFTFVCNDALLFQVQPAPQEYWDRKHVFAAVPSQWDPTFHLYLPESQSNYDSQNLLENVLRATQNITEERDLAGAFDQLFGSSGMSSLPSLPAPQASHTKHTLSWASVCLLALSLPPSLSPLCFPACGCSSQVPLPRG